LCGFVIHLCCDIRLTRSQSHCSCVTVVLNCFRICFICFSRFVRLLVIIASFCIIIRNFFVFLSFRGLFFDSFARLSAFSGETFAPAISGAVPCGRIVLTGVLSAAWAKRGTSTNFPSAPFCHIRVLVHLRIVLDTTGESRICSAGRTERVTIGSFADLSLACCSARSPFSPAWSAVFASVKTSCIARPSLPNLRQLPRKRSRTPYACS